MYFWSNKRSLDEQKYCVFKKQIAWQYANSIHFNLHSSFQTWMTFFLLFNTKGEI